MWPCANGAGIFRGHGCAGAWSGIVPGTADAAEAMEVEFATGARMRVAGSVASPTVRGLIAVLAQSKRRRR